MLYLIIKERKRKEMVVKFTKLEFKNILSFGAKPTTINFDTGLSIICGKNGTGKSTIIDALSFCLYGQPYRKIKIQELLNRKNKKNLLVTGEFCINNDTFKITRGLKPDIIEISKNNLPLDLLSSKKLNQEEIDKIIGINYKLFKQIISLSINYNEPFLSLGSPEKRDIIEQIFDIKIFSEMQKNLKKDIAEIKIKEQLNQKTLDSLTSNLTSLRKRFTESSTAKQNFDTNKNKNLEDINKKIEDKQNEINITKQKIEEISSNLKDIEEIQEKIENIDKTQNDINNKYIKNQVLKSSNEDVIRFLSNNQTCPTCNSVIEESYKNKEINNLKQKNEDIDKLLEEYSKQLKELTDEITILSMNYNKLINFKNEKDRLNDKYKIYTEHFNEYIKFKNEITERKFDIDLDSLETELKEKSEEYKIVFKQSKIYKEDLIIKDQVSKILMDNGIKSFLFEKFIPILNIKINEYLQLFSIPIRLEFDNVMNEKIINIGSKDNTSYYAYSEGEKKRIDMAILLSFINMTKLICNWNCNILLIDELLDGALDEDGLNVLVQNLNNMADISKMNILIISHRMQHNYMDQFKTIFQINKNRNNFSEIEIRGHSV